MRYLPFVEEIPFKGWDGVYLSNGLIDAVCVPEIGGRTDAIQPGSDTNSSS